MLTKVCTDCNIEKPLDEFSKHKKGLYGVVARCKSCLRKRGKIYYYSHIEQGKTYRIKNAEKRRKTANIYRTKNKAKAAASVHSYYIRNIEKIKKYDKNRRKSYYNKNKEEINLYQRKRYKSNPKHRINKAMSTKTCKSLKGNKGGKSWEKLVPYSLNDLIKHLRKNLPLGYTWDDYMNGSNLHIDHIVPISVHNFKSYTDTDFQRCWALSNLQLLPALENMSKGARLKKHFQPSLLL